MAYPYANDKMMAPVKKSIFERQKEETEAKRARDKAETEAVYEDFVKSFEQEEDYSATAARGRPNVSGYGSGPAAGKRHFTSGGLKSGPGSLGPSPATARSGPGNVGPGFGKRRNFEEQTHGPARDQRPAYQRDHSLRDHLTTDARDGDLADTHETTARPTLHLSFLPPGTSPSVIKALLAKSPLVVEDVRILPGSTTDRKALSAIVTLAAETAAADIDAVVSQLQNKYLGYGFNLSLSRHLSSAALGGAGAINVPGSGSVNLPFGARPILEHNSLSRAPPPGQGRGFAPPTSYTPSTPYQRREQSQVLVQPPNDLKALRLIHKTIETLLTHGPEFEALLMSRPQVQREEQWSWLWNSKSPGGVYYRWRLWNILTGARARQGRSTYSTNATGDFLFEGHGVWVPPDERLKFEYTTKIDEFVSDDDYDSSDEEADYDEGGLSKRHNDHNASGLDPTDAGDGHGYLNPLAKAKLTHLLLRLPDINTKLRRGDVVRLTAFAIEHAGAGALEVATLITRNVLQPLSQHHAVTDEENTSEDAEAPASDEKKDTSTASLVGLYVISDILSSSASAGVRHAWRYRQLFEAALRQHKVFEKLGRLDRDLNWGKLKADKWKRSIQSLLQLWEGWCVFPQTSHDEMVQSFLNPPLSKEEQLKLDEEEKRRAQDEANRKRAGNKWRSLDGDSDMRVSGEDLDGQAMSEDDELDDAMEVDETSLVDETVDGIPLVDSSDEEMGDYIPPPPPSPPPPPAPANKHERQNVETKPTPASHHKTPPISHGRQRPKATDMFADDSDA